MTLVQAIKGTKAGNTKAYNSLVLKINGYINQYALSTDDAEDVVSAIVERVLREDVENSSNPVAKIRRFGELEIKHIQQAKMEELCSSNAEYEFEDEAIKEIELDELKVIFKELLDTLKEKERKSLELRFYYGCTFKEIAHNLHVSDGREVVEKSLRYMRHPSRSRIVRGYVYDFD